MNTWTLTVRDDALLSLDICGVAASPQLARAKMAIAARSLLERGGDSHPRYELRVDDTLVAVLRVGVDDDGAPDYEGTAQLLSQLDRPVSPFRSDA